MPAVGGLCDFDASFAVGPVLGVEVIVILYPRPPILEPAPHEEVETGGQTDNQ